jgi:hypothetical protein
MSNAYDIISRFDPEFPRKRAGRLLTDTTEFMNIQYGDVIELAGSHFLVLRDEKERSFGVRTPNTGSSAAANWRRGSARS